MLWGEIFACYNVCVISVNLFHWLWLLQKKGSSIELAVTKAIKFDVPKAQASCACYYICFIYCMVQLYSTILTQNLDILELHCISFAMKNM